MKTSGNVIGVLTGLVLLLVLLVGGYYLFNYAANILGALDPPLRTITAIASVVAVLCSTIIAGGLKSHRKVDNTSSTQLDKANIYRELLYLCDERLKTPPNNGHWLADNEQTKIEHHLALHANPKVITAYVNLQRSIQRQEQANDEAYSLLRKLVVEMRTDLGRTEFNLNDNDLLVLLQGRYE